MDFRKLKEKTIGDVHPLPDITGILDQLGQSNYFTCLNMVMGYHQASLWVKDGPSYIIKDYELRVECTDVYTLLCVRG